MLLGGSTNHKVDTKADQAGPAEPNEALGGAARNQLPERDKERHGADQRGEEKADRIG
jgi:hypothetical protein